MIEEIRHNLLHKAWA